MFAVIALVLAVLALQDGPNSDRQIDVATAERMRQYEEYLHQEMTQLLQEIEQSRSMEEALSAFQQWLFSTIEALAMLSVVCCGIWIIKVLYDRWHKQDSSSSEEEDDEEEDDGEEDNEEDDKEEDDDDKEEDDEQEEDNLNGAPSGVRSLAGSTPSPTQDLPDTCKMLKQLVGDLLAVCRVLCKKNFLPQMHPAIGTDSSYEDWSVQENGITYCLFVFLRPPPGHSFSVELDSTGQLPARASGVHVVLECICSSGHLLGDSACFLHHSDDNLPRDQSSSFLRTLCTQSYLDWEKLASYTQHLVRSAWLLLPESHHCQLTVLPSSLSCKFQLTSTSQVNMCTEILFAVE